MQKTNRYLAAVLAVSFLLSTQPAFSADDSGVIPTQRQRSTPEKIFVQFIDGDVDTPQINSFIQEPDTSTPGAFRGGRYLAVIPTCVEVNPFPCIKSVSLKFQSEEVWENLKISGDVPQTTVANITTSSTGVSVVNYSSTWAGDLQRFIPASSEAQIYSSSSHSHAGGGQYVLKARIDGLSSTQRPNVFTPLSLAVTVLPIKGQVSKSSGLLSSISYQFPDSLEAKVQIYLGDFYQSLSGWFFGRTTNTVIDMNPGEKTLTISASPAKVPVHSGFIPFPPPGDLQTLFGSSFVASFKESQPNMRYLVAQRNTMDNWKKLENYLSPSSDYERTVWNINSTTNIVNSTATDSYKKCISLGSGFAGLISSNASVFSQSAPTWDAKESTLSYQVASPSLDSSGSKNLGNYQIALREDVAKCLWGVDLGNAKIEISVIGDNSGEKQVAVTNFKSLGGWIYFSASGFHYSAPTIKVSLTAKESIATDRATPRASAPAIKKISITCVNGKISKKISGLNPKCPTGYKKKA